MSRGVSCLKRFAAFSYCRSVPWHLAQHRHPAEHGCSHLLKRLSGCQSMRKPERGEDAKWGANALQQLHVAALLCADHGNDQACHETETDSIDVAGKIVGFVVSVTICARSALCREGAGRRMAHHRLPNCRGREDRAERKTACRRGVRGSCRHPSQRWHSRRAPDQRAQHCSATRPGWNPESA